MYLHIGQDTVVKLEDVVAIFDIETSSVSKITRNYLSRAEKEGSVITVSGELPKSFVVCRSKGRAAGGLSSGSGKNKAGITGKTVVYISQISSTTLLKRSDFLTELAKDEKSSR